MAVETTDLTFPAGRLDPAVMWPGVSAATVTTYLEAFLASGEAKVADWEAEDQDAGTTAWAYYRAFDSVYLQMVRLPSTVAFSDEGSGSTLLTQIQFMGDQRDAALAEFEELENTAEDTDPLDFTTLRSLRD